MVNDVILNKSASIERCIKRIHEEYEKGKDLTNDYTRQDSIILNLERACEACIDLAAHTIKEKKLGVPQSYRDTFTLLEKENIISNKLSEKLQHMVGFRNIAIHDYQQLNLDILKNIIEHHLNDFTDFTKAILTND